jgi:hypothetical protein
MTCVMINGAYDEPIDVDQAEDFYGEFGIDE